MTNNTYKKPAHVLLRKIGDESLLLNTDTEKYFSLNQVGTDFYHKVTTGLSANDAIAELATDYAAPTDQVSQDCEKLLAELETRNLIERHTCI